MGSVLLKSLVKYAIEKVGSRRYAVAALEHARASAAVASEHAHCGRLRWAVNMVTWEPRGGEHGDEFKYLLSLISPAEEQASVMRYRLWEDKKRCLISRLMTRRGCAAVLGLASFGGLNIPRTKGNKPFLQSPRPPSSRADLANFNFSVSHEGDWVVLASEPLCLCGVDIAAPQRGQECNIFDTFRDYLTADEWKVVQAEAKMDELMDSLVWAETSCDSHGYGAFQRFWSAKESFVKARGDGLAFNVGRAGFTFQSHPAVGEEGTAAVGYVEVDGKSLSQWTFHQTGFGDDHWITVARGPTQDVVDEIGDFRRTFLRPTPTFRAHDWSAELDCASPQFCEVPVDFLVPEDATEGFVRVGGTPLTKGTSW